MKIWDCKCEECQAEFQAVLEGADDVVECPSCNSTKIKMTETDMEFGAGCGGGCGSCGGCGSEQ